MFKKIIFILLVLPFAVAAQNNVSVNCSFVSTTADTVTLIPSQYFIDEYEKSYTAITSNRQCDFNFNVAKPTVAKLIYRHQAINIFLEPGDKLEIKVGEDSLYKSVSFSGKGALHNQFLSSFYKNFNSDFDKEKVNAEIINSVVDAFEMKLFDERKKQTAFYNSDANKNTFSDAFKKYVENTIKYNYTARLLSFPIIQANQSPKILTVKAFPAVMLEGIDAKMVSDDALNTEAYRDFIYYYTVYFTSQANGFNKFKDLNQSMESKVQIAIKNFTGTSLNWCIALLLKKDLARVSQYTAGHIYSTLNLKEGNGTYSKLLKPDVDARLASKDAAVVATENSAPVGSPSSNTASSVYPKLKDLDGKYFTFDDLKGKVVYVDYWASWCGPCRQQMPFSKQLHAMFTEKQLKLIVFLYVSIDGDENAWKNGIKQLGIEGKNGISPGNWQAPIATYFGINSIPRYMLIDKKGNIVDLNAKRPSDTQNIYNDMLKLLE